MVLGLNRGVVGRKETEWGCRIAGAGCCLEYRGIGEGGRFLMDAGCDLGLSTGRDEDER